MTLLLILPAAALLTALGLSAPRYLHRNRPAPVRARRPITALSHQSLKRHY